MRLRTLVWREMFERKNQLITSFVAILLGASVFVAVRNVTFYSEKAVARQMDALGVNILVLPKSVTVQDYYGADMLGEEIPEDYVDRLVMSDLQGLDNLSPKLSVPVTLGEREFTLTGILPKNEFQAKAMWQGIGVFSRPQGCGAIPGGDAPGGSDIKETLVRRRVIETLGDHEVLVGADVAASLRIVEGDELDLLGTSFSAIGILPETGTVDDARIFAHLHTVQDLTGKKAVVNAIEVLGCCNEISQGLVQKINTLLPEAKVVTITQIVDAQVNTNKMMSRLSLLFLVIIVLVGGASIANYIYGNVFERRHEIGTLMAIGAESSVIMSMFQWKAVMIGLVGGVGGFILGSALAVVLGPKIARIPVLPMPMLLFWSVALSVIVTFCGSYLPARRATRLDPCETLREG